MSTLADQPAFPAIEDYTVDRDGTGALTGIGMKWGTGMTLLQYYAGLAMKGILANPMNSGEVGEAMRVQFGETWRARLAIGEARALIEELEKPRR